MKEGAGKWQRCFLQPAGKRRPRPAHKTPGIDSVITAAGPGIEFICPLSIRDLIANQDSNEIMIELTRERCIKVFENLKVGVIILGADGMIEGVNPALEQTLGFSGQELKNRQFIELIHPDDAGSDYSPITDLICGTLDYCDIEKRLANKDGQPVWVRMIGSRVIEKEDGAPLLVALVEDISRQKEEEKLKDAFAGMVAHELKNPLMAVLSSLRLAKKGGQFPEILEELINIAYDGAESLWVILENLLEVSRSRAGRLTISPIPANLSELIMGVLPGIKQTLVHNLIIEIPQDLPPVIVDQARIQLIVRNLLDNAVKYSPKGGNIHIFAHHAGGEVVVGIKDEGVGISRSDLQNLFQPFERLGAKTAGMGLGLSVCRLLVEAHGGRIWVESEPQKGSTYYFSLPVAAQPVKN